MVSGGSDLISAFSLRNLGELCASALKPFQKRSPQRRRGHRGGAESFQTRSLPIWKTILTLADADANLNFFLKPS